MCGGGGGGVQHDHDNGQRLEAMARCGGLRRRRRVVGNRGPGAESLLTAARAVQAGMRSAAVDAPVCVPAGRGRLLAFSVVEATTALLRLGRS